MLFHLLGKIMSKNTFSLITHYSHKNSLMSFNYLYLHLQVKRMLTITNIRLFQTSSIFYILISSTVQNIAARYKLFQSVFSGICEEIFSRFSRRLTREPEPETRQLFAESVRFASPCFVIFMVKLCLPSS